MALNSNALVSLENVKSFLSIDTLDTSKDFILEVYINGISDYIQGAENSIMQETYVEKHFAPSGQNLVLSKKPIISVESINYTSDNSNVIGITDYNILKGQGIIFRNYGWCLEGSSFPLMGSRINYKFKNIEINYTAGYKNTPADLLMLVLGMIKNMKDYDEQGTLKSYKISDVQMTWADMERQLNSQQKSILLKYRGINI